jgi:uncharacterized integral membrane protein (TIGR00698 family)
MTTLTIGGLPARARALFPGVLACGVVAAAATFLSEHYGAPVMLFALLLGMAMNFLSAEGPCAAGVGFTGREVLRIGVALLGLRITIDQVTALGWFPPLLVVGTVALTIVASVIAARLFGFKGLFGLLTGGATAICGASAALALAAALPNHPLKERATLFTVIGVSALSTVAMIAYPMIVHALDLGPSQAGIFLGGTIHDVAQVVGAGYSISRETGDAATLVKLMRVAMLLPVIVVAVMITRMGIGGIKGAAGAARPPLLPWFAVAFAVLVVINSLGWIPKPVLVLGNDVSRWCLVASIAGIGMKTQLKELATVGIKPILLMIGETIFLALLVLLLLRWAQ